MRKLLIVLLVLLFPVTSYSMDAEKNTANMPTTASPVADEFLMEDEFDELIVPDPLEPINRAIFWFNDKLYILVLRPVGKAFQIVPVPLRIAIKNFFSNLATPIRFINASLQGKFQDAGNELTRFATNTTLGIGGFFDPAHAHFGIRKKDEDTGQTLGYYGAGPGIYLVLPVLGPSSIRDGIGLFADSRLDLTYHLLDENRDYYSTKVVDGINDQSLDKNTYENIRKDALDPYLFVRDAYIQYRRNKIAN